MVRQFYSEFVACQNLLALTPFSVVPQASATSSVELSVQVLFVSCLPVNAVKQLLLRGPPVQQQSCRQSGGMRVGNIGKKYLPTVKL